MSLYVHSDLQGFKPSASEWWWQRGGAGVHGARSTPLPPPQIDPPSSHPTPVATYVFFGKRGSGKTTIRMQMQRAYQEYNDHSRAAGKTRGHFMVDLSTPT